MKKIRTETILVIVLSIVFGFVSGILGYVIIGGPINVSDVNWDDQIVIDQPRNVTVEQDLQLKQVENDVVPTLVNIYRLKQYANPLSQAYLPSDILGQATTITSDGWIMTVKTPSIALSGNYEIVGYQSKKYQVTKFIEDKATGVIFGKMEANNLPVSKIGNSSDLQVGQTLAIVSRTEGILLSNIQRIGYQFNLSGDIVISSEGFDREIKLDVELDKKYNGAVVVDLKGQVVAVINNGKTIPINYFKGIINFVLEGKEITRPVLGVKYIDLAHTDGLVEKGDKGALVYGNPLRSSPAFGMVLDGDIIKKVDDVEINHNKSLSELISGYRAGDDVELLIQRNEEEIKVEVVLGPIIK